MFSVRDRVGDYEIVAKLKSGGMATLFLGKRAGAAGFSRHVAIKVVHEHLASDPTFVRMFVDEALLSSKIHHPNVVHVEELRQVDGRYFLVMEYVHGCSLAALMQELRRRQRTMSPELATSIAVKVAEGLHAAHSTTDANGTPLGVVHRDVSPQNVLLAFKGHVKLIDFGVAKASGRAQQTTGASLKGKIGYMSPEQAFGRVVDARTDVYALGVVLWEMLTGRRAFRADNDFALLELVRNPDVPPARTHNPAVPPALDDAIAKALAAESSERFQSAQELRKALAAAMPAAMALDDSDLAELLGTVMTEAIQAELDRLPESVSRVMAKTTAGRTDALATLTVSATGIETLSEPPLPLVPDATHEPAPAANEDAANEDPEIPSSSERSPRLWLWALGAVLGVALVASITALVLKQLTHEPPGVVASELPIERPEEPRPEMAEPQPAEPHAAPQTAEPELTEPQASEPPVAASNEAEPEPEPSARRPRRGRATRSSSPPARRTFLTDEF